jgi:hypothetical protein
VTDDTKALVPSGQSRSAGLAAFIGSLPERVMAFDQIAMAIASSQAFPGYDTVQKVKAACWAADALAVHPVAYMSGVYAANMGGKLVMIPKVTFEDGLLRSRLPGYDYVVHQETAKVCEIEFFAAGRKPQRVKYTIEQAQTAKLAEKDTYKNYPDKMLFARCFHMGAHRIGPHILAGLPDPADYDGAIAPADLDRPSREPSSAVVLDDAAELTPAVEAGDGSEGAAPSTVPATPPDKASSEPPLIVDWHLELSSALKRVFGRLNKDQLIQKASTVWAAIAHQRGFPVPEAFAKAKDFGPVEAQLMTEWLRAKYPKETAGDKGPTDGPGTEAPPARDEPEAVELPPDDEAPPMQAAVAEAEALVAEQDERVEAIFSLVASARRTHPNRDFVVESPKGLGTWWFSDREILMSFGYDSSVMLQKGGEQRVSPSDCVRFVKALREAGAA